MPGFLVRILPLLLVLLLLGPTRGLRITWQLWTSGWESFCPR
uniref:Galactosidase beta 1 n=1 Tax=Homo sapiens TaxID=9606 RepID=F8WEN1_HUMAN